MRKSFMVSELALPTSRRDLSLKCCGWPEPGVWQRREQDEVGRQ